MYLILKYNIYNKILKTTLLIKFIKKMKKVFTLFVAMLMLGSVSFAQTFRVNPDKPLTRGQKTQLVAQKAEKQLTTRPTITTPKAAGDTVSNFPWTEGFESGTTPAGFTFIDADNDNYTWEVYNFGTTEAGHNNSDYVVTSASYINNVGALTPDNWMVLPSFSLPAGSDYELTWYEKGQDANYALENYSVYISTTGRAVSNFTATTAVYTGTSTSAWVKRTVSLASYAGQTIHVAFRHHNITDMYYLDIDDIRVGAAGVPEISINGSAIALMNQPAHFSANTNATTVAWYVDGNVQSSTGINLDYTFTTAGAHQVVATATNTFGSASDTLDVTVVDCGTAISTFPYTETFEAENPCWTFVSADDANDDNVGITSEEAHQGNSSYVLSSYASADDYNQFLITPEISLPSTGQYMVKFWYMGYRSSDAFRVKVSSTTNDTAAFTTVLADYPTVATDWTEVAFVLPNNAKYVAINYYGNYAYYLYVDDFSIEEMGAPSVSVSGPESIGTGNEATFTATANLAESLQWYVDGVADATTDVMTTIFTTVGNHTVVCTATNIMGSASDTMIVDVFSCDGITIPYAPDFSDGFGCWINVSDSTEDMGWIPSVDAFESDPVGQVISMSAQSFFGMMFDVPVDNWMTSPLIEMPATGTYEVAWQVKPFEPEYAGDHYGVYLIQGAQKTLLFEETLNSNMTDFVQRVAAIPGTVTGDFRVAFRHFNSEGGYVIILDNIQLRALSAPIVTISGPASVMVGNTVTYTADCSNADSYAWTIDGVAQTSTTNTVEATFTTAGDHTVAVAATNTIGTTNATKTVNAYTCDPITEFPWVESFEGDMGCWQFVTNSSDNGFVLYQGEYAQYANSGSSLVVGAYNDYMDVDAWLISPELQLPSNAPDLNVSWYVTLSEYEGIVNTYEVLVSTTGSNPSNFNTQIFEETGATDGYVRRTASLANYAGQTIRIAFHNISAMGGDAMFLDDISVQDQIVGIDEANEINLAVYPNPVNNVVNVMGDGIETVQIIDVNGRTVMTANAGSINISGLANGVYFVRAITANGIAVQKIVKK